MAGRFLIRPATASSLVVAGIAMLTGLFSTARVNAESVLFAFRSGSPNDAVEMRAVEVSPAQGDAGMALRVDGEEDSAWAGIVLKAPHGHWNLCEHDGLLFD